MAGSLFTRNSHWIVLVILAGFLVAELALGVCFAFKIDGFCGVSAWWPAAVLRACRCAAPLIASRSAARVCTSSTTCSDTRQADGGLGQVTVRQWPDLLDVAAEVTDLRRRPDVRPWQDWTTSLVQFFSLDYIFAHCLIVLLMAVTYMTAIYRGRKELQNALQISENFEEIQPGDQWHFKAILICECHP